MFCKNVDFKNYHMPISTGTKTAKGGTAIYVLKKHNFIERYYLKPSNIEYESNKENKEIYICGDFNTNLLKYDEDSVVQEFYDLMTSQSFIPQITLPTWITDSSMTLIDNNILYTLYTLVLYCIVYVFK